MLFEQGLTPSLDEARERYQTDGYWIARRVFDSEEVAALASEATTLLERRELMQVANPRCRWQTNVRTGACEFDCFDPVTDIGPVSRYAACHPQLLQLLRGVYDDEPCLFKDKLIFKRPGAGGYALHQDFIGWDDFPATFVTAIVAIDAADAENGAAEVFAGAHRHGYLSPFDGDYHELPADAVEEEQRVLLELEPGDVAIFGGFMPHRSAPNYSDRWRRQLYLSYNARRDGGDRREDHYRSYVRWLRKKYAEFGRTEVYFQ